MDHEELSLEEMLDSAYSRALTDFKNHNLAQQVAIDATDEYATSWAQRMADPSQKDGGTIPGVNPAYYLDQMITIQTKKHKDYFIRKHRNGKKPISREDFWLWFTEDLLDYAKKRGSPYMAVAVLMVLCEYHSNPIHEIYGFVAQSRNLTDTSFYRRDKGEILAYMKKRYGPFTEVQRVQKNEKRYAKDSGSAEYVNMFKTWLMQLTPLHPQCFLPDSFNPHDMENQYINHNGSGYPDGIERNRRHVMQCPKCLTKLLLAANYDDWSTSFGLPKITLRGPDAGDDGPSSGRAEPRSLNLESASVRLVKKILGRRNIRRQRLDFRSLFVAIDNGKPQKIRPNQKIQIRLEDGDSAIRVSGKDWKGRLPLDTHLISWDEDLIDNQRVFFRTILSGDRKLLFSVKYQPDMLRATAEVEYLWTPEPLLKPALNPGPLWPDFVKAGGLLAGGFAVLILATVISSLWSRSSANEPAKNSGSAALKSEVPPETKSSNGIGPVTASPTPVDNTERLDNTTKRENKSASNKTEVIPGGRQQYLARDGYVQESRRRRFKPKPKQVETSKASWPHSRDDGGSRIVRFVKKIKKEAGSVAGSMRKGIGNLISASPEKPQYGTETPNVSADNKVSTASTEEPAEVTSAAGVFRSANAERLSSKIVPPPATTLTGIVTDVNDNPIPFAIILFRARQPGVQPAPTISSGQVAVVCDGEGRFAVRYTTGETYDLAIEQNGFAPAIEMAVKVARETASPPKIHIKLQPARAPEDFLIDRRLHRRLAKQNVDSF